jgi:hypothetical protein
MSVIPQVWSALDRPVLELDNSPDSAAAVLAA